MAGTACEPPTPTNPAHVGEETPPRPVGGIATPARQVRRLRQLEHDGSLAGLDHRRHQRAVAIGQRCLGAHPAGVHGFLRPEDDHGLGIAQRLLGDLVVGLAGTQRGVPPDVEALALEGFGKLPGSRLIVAVIRQEDVGQAGPRFVYWMTDRTRTGPPQGDGWPSILLRFQRPGDPDSIARFRFATCSPSTPSTAFDRASKLSLLYPPSVYSSDRSSRCRPP